MDLKVTLASVQFESKPGDKTYNFSRMRSFIKTAAMKDVKILAFPECCITGYWFLRHLSYDQLFWLAEPLFSGPSCQLLLEMAIKYKMTIGAGLIEKTLDGKIYNSYVVAMPDGNFQRHRKLHPFVNQFIERGNEFTVFNTPHGCRVGILICYDNNIIENVRINSLLGAQILLAPHQTGGCRANNPNIMGVIEREIWDNRLNNPKPLADELKGPKGREWLMRWLPSRAHDNGIFVVFSNGIGIDDDEIRTGNSMIIDPYGRIITETCKAGNDMITAEIDLNLIKNSTGQRWILTRRPDLYHALVKLTGDGKDIREIRFDNKGC
jgi:predicted amidohydrolase